MQASLPSFIPAALLSNRACLIRAVVSVHQSTSNEQRHRRTVFNSARDRLYKSRLRKCYQPEWSPTRVIKSWKPPAC